MIPIDVRQEILRRLAMTEREHGVRIILAVESGSRAWGFSSPDSDFDVRFIYVRPADWYLAVDLESRRDVIEYPITDDIDLNGWDVRKALGLFWKSNPAFVEWIQSPIRYSTAGGFADAARELLAVVFSPWRGIHHYRSMAKNNYRSYLRSDVVPLKKYFYALRPLLAVQWIEKYGSAAPIEFETLMGLLPPRSPLLHDIQLLLDRKRESPELGMSARLPSINAFIEEELQRLEPFTAQRFARPDVISRLNQLFHATLDEASAVSGVQCR